MANDDQTLMVKFADDTTICGFIKKNDESAYRRQIDATVNWCDNNNLILNVTKTKELIIDFRNNKKHQDATDNQ